MATGNRFRPEETGISCDTLPHGKAREAALEIKAEELNTNDGMKILLTELDSVFQKDSIDLAYEAYTLF